MPIVTTLAQVIRIDLNLAKYYTFIFYKNNFIRTRGSFLLKI